MSNRSLILLLVVSLFAACTQKRPDYYVCAYIWPSCHDDSIARRWIWPEGEGEWEVIKKGTARFEGHYQPRIPLWGYEMDDDPEVAEKWINTALEYGVNTFIYDWYWFTAPDGWSGPFLEGALDDGFLKAPSNRKMNFYILYANHDVAYNFWNCHKWGDNDSLLFNPRVGMDGWKKIVHRVITRYFHLPNYLKIDGCPVFSMYDTNMFVEGFSGPEEAAAAMDYFRNEVRNAGFPGLHLQVSSGKGSKYWSDPESEWARYNTLLGVNSISFYTMGRFDCDYIVHNERALKARALVDSLYDIPLFPTVSTGWDNTPRFPDMGADKVTRFNHSPKVFAKYLRTAKEYADAHRGTQPPFVMINAWNEWVEGSYLLPDEKDGYAWLEAVRDVFGARHTKPFGFYAYTVPRSDSLYASCDAVREGNEWTIEVNVRNNSGKEQVFKLALAAEPGFKADSWLIPGVNYNGNPYGEDMPQGWEKDGQPWVFAYDRSSIPSCTVSENASQVFALFASDADTASYVSSCSMEKLSDGSFRHIIYWPDSEGPVCYSGKKSFTEGYDNCITLQPGESFKVKAMACTGKPQWKNYGFAEVFPVAWKHLRHDNPSRRSMAEIVRLDKAFQDWSRRQDEHGYWYGGIVDDQVFCAGYYESGRSSDGYNVADYDANPSLNRWATDEIAQSEHLAPGEYVHGAGRSIGFGAQSFQMARLSIENGLRNGIQEDLDFGLAVFRSWNRERRFANGLYNSHKPRVGYVINASNVGWAISELSRTSALLKEYGRTSEAEEFRQAAAATVKTVLAGVQDDGCIGSLWKAESGEVVGRGGDSAGYVLMGLVRWWQLVRDDSLLPLFKKAFAYYYGKDIDYFRCSGGAMDCVSVDREGIHPFLAAAVALYRETGDREYLEYAHKAAWYFLSWLYIHNPVYGPDTDFAKYDWKPAGATIVGAEHPALDEYACVLIPEFMELARIDANPMWRDVAALIWRYSTQGFADENHRIWHGLERPVGSKNEAIFPTRWSKYHLADKARGSINDHLTAWGGTYRLASILELSEADLEWLDDATRPLSDSVFLENLQDRLLH